MRQYPKQHYAFTLIEFLIFLVVVGFISAGIIKALATTFHDVPDIEKQSKALELAQQRMDIILAQKEMVGFSSFTDICDVVSPPALCNTDTDYTISSTITTGFDGNNDLKTIAVTVTGDGNATLNSMVGDY